jgi:glycosyltransferase involved in cell wall biosynthesis
VTAQATTAARAGSAARVYTHLRTAHLERFQQMVPARVMYVDRRYDFDESLIDPTNPPVQCSRIGVLLELARRHHSVLEINEPTMVSNWAFLLAQIAVVRLRGLLSRRRTMIVAYCIGVTDPAVALARRRWMPKRFAGPVARALMRILVGSTDRLAFGTTGSRDLYEACVGRDAIARRSALFEALPSACECLAGSTDVRVPMQLAFVGKLTARKGIEQAMHGWDVVRRENPGARLHIIGKGELEPEVLAWAFDKPEVSVEIDPPRERIHQVLRGSGALVCLAQPSPVREQIGLPILEGLGHGCEIIATSETGLAQWLINHGHNVVAPDASARQVADAMADALARAATRRGSLAELPDEDQRIAADRWMMTGSGEPTHAA